MRSEDKVASWRLATEKVVQMDGVTLMEEEHLVLFSFINQLNSRKRLMKEPYLDDAHKAALDGEWGGGTRG